MTKKVEVVVVVFGVLAVVVWQARYRVWMIARGPFSFEVVEQAERQEEVASSLVVEVVRWVRGWSSPVRLREGLPILLLRRWWMATVFWIGIEKAWTLLEGLLWTARLG